MRFLPQYCQCILGVAVVADASVTSHSICLCCAYLVELQWNETEVVAGAEAVRDVASEESKKVH